MNVAVLGTGAWGTTLAIMLARRGMNATLWARTQEEASTLQADRQNAYRLPDYEFPPSLVVTADLEAAMSGASAIILAVPSNAMRANVKLAQPFVDDAMLIVSATKGLERGTSKRMSEVMAEELPERSNRRLCVLSGPNLSKEIAEGQPASTVVAAYDETVAEQAVAVIMEPRFRAYTNTDVVGVELGGAFKNIVAIGAGMSDGLGYGDSAKAGFITRGLAEITRLGEAAGAKPLTFAGLACLGDLIATCSSKLSRNYFVGEQLAKGRPLKSILEGMRNVAEGVDTTVAALEMASSLGVEMPIAETTRRVLFDGVEPEAAVRELLTRSPKAEWTGMTR